MRDMSTFEEEDNAQEKAETERARARESKAHGTTAPRTRQSELMGSVDRLED